MWMQTSLVFFFCLHLSLFVCVFRPRAESHEPHIHGMGSKPYLAVNGQPFVLDTTGIIDEKTPINYFNKFLTPNCFCRKELFGDVGQDGYKFACADFISSNNCSVISLGSNNNIIFESTIFEKKGCKSLTIDMDQTSLKMPHYVTFQKGRIGSCSNCIPLKDVVPPGGVDILKIDIEQAEWEVIQEMETVDANMILIEIHWLSKDKLEKLRRMDKNWCLANVDLNIHCTFCLELLLVNRRLTTLRLK
eukprot:TRINITY_DN282_c0_g1_i5.p1 TRINITY_DN282_c0_g1~~TRINITY_DN282_c0_g1_i5.p1  ORF type:complete len:254 (-),score=41.54 TRINITY_DN282_c0_g1_i5:38-778(-)